MLFRFFNTKTFWVCVVWGQFSIKCWKKFKKKFFTSLEFIAAFFKVQQVINTRGGLKLAPR